MTASLLFVPAEERRLDKIGKVNAGSFIIDLEDSIAEKDDALEKTIGFLSVYKDYTNLYVRINKARCEIELKALEPFPVGIMLPKFEDLTDYAKVRSLLKGRNVIALIETPKALANAGAIAALPWITSLAFGAEDFTTATNIRNSYDNLFVFKSLLVLSAKANGKKVYDTPCFNLSDDEVLCTELKQAVDLGFDGKLAIHPKQISKINQSFMVHEIEYIKHLISVYDSSGNAVCAIDGVVYERMHIDKMRKMIAEREKDI